ncbi:MAG: tRNA pseudouridine(55) synthase TruB, partial [Chloroflexota bacterium]
MARPETNTRPVSNGFVNLDKPPGITSMDVVRRVKRITGQRQKVGHGGTMDPLARGVLPICFGQATRLMDYVVEGTKRYLMEIKLGVATTTYDAEGQVTQTSDVSGLTQEQVEAALPCFLGVIQQTPPMYSAIKVEGQRLYKLARAGIEVERKARTV